MSLELSELAHSGRRRSIVKVCNILSLGASKRPSSLAARACAAEVARAPPPSHGSAPAGWPRARQAGRRGDATEQLAESAALVADVVEGGTEKDSLGCQLDDGKNHLSRFFVISGVWGPFSGPGPSGIHLG